MQTKCPFGLLNDSRDVEAALICLILSQASCISAISWTSCPAPDKLSTVESPRHRITENPNRVLPQGQVRCSCDVALSCAGFQSSKWS